MYFIVNKMSYIAWSAIFFFFFFFFFFLLLLTDSMMPIKRPNLSRMCLRYKTSSKLCSFSATVCPMFNVD